MFSKKFYTSLMAVVILSGCSSFVKNPELTKVVTKTEVIFVQVPEAYLKNCNIPRPPDPQKYLLSDWLGKEEILITSIKAHITSLAVCNSNTEKLRQWNNEQKEIYSPTKPKE